MTRHALLASLDLLGRRPVAAFFALACALSWLLWLPLALGLGAGRPALAYLHPLGGMGPMLAAFVAGGATVGRSGVRALLAGMFRVRGRGGWVALGALAPIGLFLVAALIMRIGGHPWPRRERLGASTEFPALGAAGYTILNVVFYGFGEEVGWRGYALPHLQARSSAFAAALKLTVLWAAWHLPLFWFSPGLSRMGPAEVVGWVASLATGSLVLSWLFNSSRGSILAVALFHGVLDVTMTSSVEVPLTSVMGAVITMAGLAIPLVFGREHLARVARQRARATPGGTS